MHEGDTRETRGRYQGHIRDWETLTHASGIIVIIIHRQSTVVNTSPCSLLITASSIPACPAAVGRGHDHPFRQYTAAGSGIATTCI